ncbi:MAG: type IVB secretion system protein IcmV [Gammaproteobacteria bacterium]
MKNKTDSSTPPPKASKTKRLVLFFFNPRVWGDWDRSKAISLFFLEMIERFFVLRGKNKKTTESFEHAVAKFDLDEKTLQAKATGLKRLSYSLVGVAIFLFLYTFYQLFFGSYRGAIIALIEVGIALVLAFRYHFWYYQIKQRKLGCSVKEWFKNSFTGGNP